MQKSAKIEGCPEGTAKGFWGSPGVGVALLLLLAVVVYMPAMRGGFIWDDDDHLTANPAMTMPGGLRLIWSSLAVSRYYPLTLTSFWVQRQFWGLNPLPYHIVNVVLHAINGVLIFLLLRRLRVKAAWVAAALWVVHPVNVESVAWVTELKNTQSGVFFFLAMLCFLQFEDHGKGRWYALALVCGLAALLSKPSTVVLPVVLLLCVWWERGTWRRVDLLRVAPFFGLALGMSALTILEQHRLIRTAGALEWKLGMAERMMIAGKAVWFYAGKLLRPAPLTFIYPRWELDARSVWCWIPLVGLVAAGVVLWLRRQQRWARAGLWGGGFFVAALLPVLGFFDVYFFRFSFVADHFQYLASLGLVALVAGAGARICEGNVRWGRQMGAVAVPVALLVLGTLTWNQERVYRDIETLWRDTLTKNPNAWMAHNNLGIELQEQGKLDEAMRYYEQALRLKPDYPEARYNWGYALVRQGKVAEAIAQYEQALRIKPDYAEAHNNLGYALLRQGKIAEAIMQWEQALRFKAAYPEARYNLGNALLQMEKVEEAITQYEQALRIKPDYAEAHNNLGYALLRQGKIAEAIVQWEQALRIQPDYVEARINLGSALLQAGRIDEAIAQYEQALRIKPDSAEARYNLGNALLKAGRIEEAIAQYQQALRIKPSYAEARNNLGNALRRQRTGSP